MKKITMTIIAALAILTACTERAAPPANGQGGNGQSEPPHNQSK